MGNRIVISLGGNAIHDKDLSATGQQEVIVETVKKLLPLIQFGNQLIITHGNGPQVGNLLLQQKVGELQQTPPMPLDACVSMTQGSIGYWLQNAFTNELRNSHLLTKVASLITQVKVQPDDVAFHNPSKPIGPLFSREDAIIEKRRSNSVFIEDEGKGWRKVVPSPKPIEIIEADIIKKIVDEGFLVIAGGGGGIPVIEKEGKLVGVDAVIEKDLVSAKIASLVNADYLVFLTKVTHAYINFNTSQQRNIEQIDWISLNTLKEEGHFGRGTMLPKIQAAQEFIMSNPQGKAVITSVDNIGNLFTSYPGTLITA